MAVVRSESVNEDDETLPVVYIEVDDLPVADAHAPQWGDAVVRGSRAEKVVDVARDFLGDGVALVRTCAERFAGGLGELPAGVRAPDEVELALRISFDSELGAVLVKAKAGAQLEVKMRWRRQDTSSDQSEVDTLSAASDFPTEQPRD